MVGSLYPLPPHLTLQQGAFSGRRQEQTWRTEDRTLAAYQIICFVPFPAGANAAVHNC